MAKTSVTGEAEDDLLTILGHIAYLTNRSKGGMGNVKNQIRVKKHKIKKGGDR
jgi:hypothetical protein